MRAPLYLFLPCCLLPLLAALACSPAPGRRADAILISIDTLRADHLSCYGYERATSPTIDRIASEGVRCERSWSSTSWTLPAHLSMLTGLSVSAHGVCDDRLWQAVGKPGAPAELPLRGVFLSEELQAAGYHTAGFYSWKYLDPQFGFGPGFEVYERIGGSVWSEPELKARFDALRAAGEDAAIREWMAREPELFDEQRPTAGLAVDRALAWVRERVAARKAGDDAPIFLFLHLFDVHDEYVPPAPFDQRFTQPDYRGPINGRQVTSPNSLVRPGMPAEDLAQLIALYDGEIAWVDSELGRLRRELESLGIFDDALLVLTADHGEEFFEHGAKTHRSNLHVESLHVPLIFRFPASLPAGQVLGGDTGLVDIAPTLYELLDVPGPAQLTGVSLASELCGGPLTAREYLSELLLFGSSFAPERQVAVRGHGQQVLTREPAAGQRQVARWDFSRTPLGEGWGTVLQAPSPELAAFEADLDRWRARLQAQRAAAPPRGGQPKPLSADDLAELARMGYVGAGEAPAELGAAGGDPSRLCLDGCIWPDK